MISVRAPGVVKLFGEHAVVYGKTSVAMAIDRHAYATIDAAENSSLTLTLSDFGKSASFTNEELVSLYKSYRSKDNIADLDGRNNAIREFAIEKGRGIDPDVLPPAVISSILLVDYGLDIRNKEIKISSDIPVQKGFASSAACSTALTLALLKDAGLSLTDNEVVEIARNGEIVGHTNEGAGRIDISTSYYGGFVSYKPSTGARREHAGIRLNLLVIDTGPKKSTAETVGHVRALYNKNPEYMSHLFEAIERCSIAGLEALSRGDLKKVGSLMYENQSLLEKIGVSSEGLEKAVGIAKEHGAFGAKLSGGGGGGIAIALTDDPESLSRAFRGTGYESYLIWMDAEGAGVYNAVSNRYRKTASRN